MKPHSAAAMKNVFPLFSPLYNPFPPSQSTIHGEHLVPGKYALLLMQGKSAFRWTGL